MKGNECYSRKRSLLIISNPYSKLQRLRTVRVLDLAERTWHEALAGPATRRLQRRVAGLAEVTSGVATEHRSRLLARVPAGHGTLPEGTRVRS